MNTACRVTQDLNAYHSHMDSAELREARMPVSFMASNLCYGEPLDLYLHGDQQLNHAMLVEAVINSDDFAKALIAIQQNDLLPLQELMSDCAKELINKARGE